MATKSFSADVEQLIQLVTHSVYSDQEIFLRELISNANDAIQKAKLKSAQDANYLGDQTDFHITIDVDNTANTVTITDTGIGMTKEKVQENIGTIAKSGTAAFIEQLKQAQKDKNKSSSNSSDLVGQFGIGFYSAFMVANKVTLETKSHDSDDATLWTSEGKGKYDIKKSKKTTRGTTITLYLKEEDKEYSESQRIKSLIKKHSNYIPVPIMMWEEEKKDDKEEKKENNKKEVKNKKGKYVQINDMKSLRSRRKSDIKKEEYIEFYKSMTFDQEEPLDILHIQTEGALSYKALLFIPQKTNPMAAMMGGGDNREEYGPDLYVQNVLIKEKSKDLLPVWLRFVRGVVETNDLNLNMSRELIQKSTIIDKLQTSLVKEVLKSLTWKKRKEFTNYLDFHDNYGRILKEGIHFDRANKEKIAEIVLFHSMQQDKQITLDEYIEHQEEKTPNKEKKEEKKDNDKKDTSDTKETKQYIYYLVGTSLEELQNSPYLTKFKQHKTDVLLMTDPVDEYVVNSLREYKDHTFTLASDKNVSLKDKKTKKKEEKEIQQAEQNYKNFIAYLKSTLGKDTLGEVHFSKDLGDALALITTKEGQQSAQMQKIMKSMGQELPTQPKDIQINLDHPLTKNMLDEYTSDPKSTKLKNMVQYMYEQAIILEGGEINDLSKFITRVNDLIK